MCFETWGAFKTTVGLDDCTWKVTLLLLPQWCIYIYICFSMQRSRDASGWHPPCFLTSLSGNWEPHPTSRSSGFTIETTPKTWSDNSGWKWTWWTFFHKKLAQLAHPGSFFCFTKPPALTTSPGISGSTFDSCNHWTLGTPRKSSHFLLRS